MTQIKPLPAELQKVAIEQLGEIPSRISTDLETLKEWMQQEAHLTPLNDDQYLVHFLRSCKYSLEKAKQKLDFWLSFPSKYLIDDIEEPTFCQLCNKGCILPLPMPLHGFGPRIVLIRCNFSPQDFTADQFIRYFMAVVNAMIAYDPYASIYGCIYYCDFSKTTPSHALEFNINVVINVLIPVLRNLIFRFKGVCVLNLPVYADHLARVALKAVPEKMRNRITFGHKDSSELVPQKYLPLEYGGANSSLAKLIVDEVKVLNEHKEFLKRLHDCRSDERLRMGKSPFNCENEILGIDGSFRSLTVD